MSRPLEAGELPSPKKAKVTPKAKVGPAAAGAGPSSGASGGTASGKKKSPTAAAIASAARMIRDVAQQVAARGSHVRMQDLQKGMEGTPQEVLLAALNQLMTSGALAAAGTLNGQPVFKLQSVEEANKLRDLTAEDRLVLQEVEKAGVSAISTKELRFRAGGLPQQSLNKILKRLEQRQLVKPVKSVNAGNVKKYMLFGLAPSKEVTGGPWYCEGEFDYDFISKLKMAALGFVQQKQQATAADVHAFIRNSGIIKSNDTLRTVDVESVLDSLVYDARLEMTAATVFGDERTYRSTAKFPTIEELAKTLVSVPACECYTCRGLAGPAGRYVPCPNLSAWLDKAVSRRSPSR